MLTRTAIVHPEHGCPARQVKTVSLALLCAPVEGMPCERSLDRLLLLPQWPLPRW
jgi:hypothetical protein